MAFYLNLVFIRLMTNLKVVSNFGSLITVKRILCNEKKIVEHDEIDIKQIALCEKNDLISASELINLDAITVKVLQEV